LPNTSDTDLSTSPQGIDRLALTARLHETLAQELAILGFRLDELISDTSLAQDHRAEIREIRLLMIGISRRFRDDIYLTNNRSRKTLELSLAEILADLYVEIDLSYPPLRSQEEKLLNEVLVELARNAVRHSGAKSFFIAYENRDDGIELTIVDDGCGMPSPSRKNLGLVMIDQSLRLMNCNYQCSSTSDGTSYRIQIPFSIIDKEGSQ
jgi:signal transduction histidine kinase